MSAAIPFSSDLGSLVVFDPASLQHRVREERRWWRVDPLSSLPEQREGRVAILPIGREGSYRVSLQPAEVLSERDAALAVGSVSGFSLRVSSGEVFVGAAEWLPGDGHGARISHIPDTGALLQVEPGDYALEAWVLDWRGEDDYFDEDGEVLPDAPCDFVLLLTPLAVVDSSSSEEPAPLLDLLPKAEAKGKAKVRQRPARKPVSLSPPRRRRGRAAAASRPAPLPARAPTPVPSEPGAYSPAQVRAAFLGRGTSTAYTGDSLSSAC